MATTIKKISELEQITELSSSSNVIIEENGKAKRIAANNFAVGGSSEQVQADLSQNDPTKPDYVKNRTHWEEGSQTVIEWDGNTEGRDSIGTGAGTFYKVSDLTPDKTDILGGTFTVVYNGTTEVVEIGESNIDVVDNGLLITGGVIVIVESETIVYNDIEIIFPSTGMYFAVLDNNARISSLTYGSTTIHQLDEKFIPESIARKTDVTWESLPDKPFGEEISVTETEILPEYKVYFSNMASSGGPVNAGIRSGIPFTGTVADGDRCIITVSCDYESGAIYNGTYECTAYTANNQVLVGDKYYWMDCSGEHTAEVPFCLCPAAKTGVGIMGSSFTIRIVKVEEGVTINKLDEKFIPESIARTSDIPEVNYPVTSVNGMTGDVVIEAGSGSGSSVQPDWSQNDKTAADYVKNRTHWKEKASVEELFSETDIDFSEGYISRPSTFQIEDGEYTVVIDGVSYVYTPATYQGMTYIGDISNDPILVLIRDGNLEMFISAGGTHSVEISRVKVAYHKLDNKYIDAMREFIIPVDFNNARLTSSSTSGVNAGTARYKVAIETAYSDISRAHSEGQHLIVRLDNLNGMSYYFNLVNSDNSYFRFESTTYVGNGLSRICSMHIELSRTSYASNDTQVLFQVTYLETNMPPKAAVAIADLTAAPTMEDFNNLLTVLRNAGYLATE